MSSSTASHASAPTPPRRPLSRRRRWAFRLLAATLVPLLFFALLEGALRIIGFGPPTSFTVQESREGTPHYVTNKRFGERFFPPEVARSAYRFWYPVEKPPRTVRIFILGESAAQGDPEAAYSFSRMLDVLLTDAYPGVNFEVI